jgi:hypothetical protein
LGTGLRQSQRRRLSDSAASTRNQGGFAAQRFIGDNSQADVELPIRENLSEGDGTRNRAPQTVSVRHLVAVG